MEPFVGQIQIFGFNFAPQGWALCNGTLLAISSNSALFSLLGTTFGGDGRTTFGLPDLRGRIPLHSGQGPGLSPITWGQKGGVESVSILTGNLPAHNHAIRASSSDATSDEPLANSRLGVSNANVYASAGTSDVTMASDTTALTGSNTPLSIRNPYLGVYYSIALFGVYPSRS